MLWNDLNFLFVCASTFLSIFNYSAQQYGYLESQDGVNAVREAFMC